MRVLARIPSIDAACPVTGLAAPPAVAPVADEPAPLADAQPAADVRSDADAEPARRPLPRREGRDERRVRRRGPTFPLKSVVALGILAVVAWSLASWSEHQRLARHRQERMARVSEAFSAQGTTR